MLNSGFLGEIYGCISTGKEANVYHATGAGGADLAVKVYKTSILAFKDRDRRARRTCSAYLHATMCEQCHRHATWWSLTADCGTDCETRVFQGVLLCRYVTGDFRFRFGYCKSNPRKMVKVGACACL